jgi:hypothetical protein
MIVFFGVTWATSAKPDNVGNKPGVTCSNVNADGRVCDVTLGGGAILGLLVSNTTLSGSVSIELILMTGLSVLL